MTLRLTGSRVARDVTQLCQRLYCAAGDLLDALQLLGLVRRIVIDRSQPIRCQLLQGCDGVSGFSDQLPHGFESQLLLVCHPDVPPWSMYSYSCIVFPTCPCLMLATGLYDSAQ